MNRAIATLILASLIISTLPLNVAADETQDIPANAQATGMHDSLVAALSHANLVTALQAEGPFTVFAPTDAAFAAAGIDLADFDTDAENATLEDILLYHVYSGSVASSAVSDGLSVEMLNGDNASFTVANGTVMIGDATVTTPDVTASNGIIHVIDTVLMPPADVVDPVDIPTVASSTGVHDSLVAALVQAGLVETLQGDGPFTVFAPTDQAFADAGIDLTSFDTPEENETLANILLYHVYAGAVPSSAVTDELSVKMVNGDMATFGVDSTGAVTVGTANVTGADVEASNGIIHVIDAVLMPPAGEICYNMVSHTINPTATNDVCNSYTYVENYSMAGQTITGCYNTVTHAVSNVSQAECSAYTWTPAVDLATTAAATTIHTSLVAALTVAELTATLSGTTDYTVFAPSDDAFAAAGIDLSSFDTPEEIAILANILLYHVVPGTTLSSDLPAGMTNVTAANEDTLLIHVEGSSVMVGESMANVTLADVPASNGVIHVIDQVLMPPAADPFEGIDCAQTVGIGTSGYVFSPSVVNIAVGETVCWYWEGASMPHNVKEVDGFKSTTFVENGITSGAAMSTVAFSHTFTEDTTFYYACEPHVGLDMFGEVVVGDGGVEDSSSTTDADDENTPGFLFATVFIAMFGALLVMSRSSRES